MASRIIEFFGYAPADDSVVARAHRRNLECPFLDSICTKTLRDGSPSGACTLQGIKNERPVICCPVRLYADGYKILLDVAEAVFGKDIQLVKGRAAKRKGNSKRVVVFGRRWGRELRLPQRSGKGSYFVDWILALLSDEGHLKEFVAVEVQSIDTTGNYQAERAAYLKGHDWDKSSTAGFNWENVHKRILPQIIYKGHVLRREPLCKKGLFFVCPTPVYERIQERLGEDLMQYPLQPGTLTFRWYDVGPPGPSGTIRHLRCEGQFTSTIDQVALAFTAPKNLPPPQVYEKAIREQLA